MMLESINEAALTEMRHILEGIRDGQYKLDQRNWHCGSFHCFFGWKQVLDVRLWAKRNNYQLKEYGMSKEEWQMLAARAGGRYTVEIHVKEAWGLTQTECDLLSQGSNTLETLFVMVSYFELGHRLRTVDDTLTFYDWAKDNWETYIKQAYKTGGADAELGS